MSDLSPDSIPSAACETTPEQEPEVREVQMPRLTAVILALDDKDLITQTVRSVEAFAAEVLVVDVLGEGSPAADTPWGSKTMRVPWEGDFADLKNRAAAKATGEWILWLNAGEVFLGDFVEPLIGFLALEADRDAQYFLMVEQPGLGRQDGAEEIADLRLTPRRRGLDFEGRIRETTQRAAQRRGIRSDGAPGRILQPLHAIETRRKMARRNLAVAQISLDECERPEARFLLAKAEAHTVLGELDAARSAYGAALPLCEPGSPEQLEAHVGMVTILEAFPEALAEQIAAAAAALEDFPTDSPLLCAMGNLMRRRDRVDLARRSFEAALTHGAVEPRTWHSTEVFDVAAVCLSSCLEQETGVEGARRVLEEALEERPYANRVRRRLIELEIGEGREEGAVALLDGMLCTDEERESLEAIIRGACRLKNGDGAAAVGHLQPVYVGGCIDPWCFRWFVRTLVAANKVEAAAEVAGRWGTIDPRSTEARQYQEAIASLAAQ